MNSIAILGDQILQIQSGLGLSNPKNLNPGMTNVELAACPLFAGIPTASELHDLFGWRNGCVPNVPMGKLWFIPGHYLSSAQEAVQSNHYMVKNILDWKSTWFPVMEGSSPGFYLFDKAKISNGRIPVFYNDPEFSPGMWRIYDDLECMFRTILECYEEGAYFVGESGYLSSDARRETNISKRLNPKSDHWLRNDLY
jgi:hypothetical protein